MQIYDSEIMRRFEDRVEAGKELAEELTSYKDEDDVLVLGLPRGGVPVAYEVAKNLNAPMNILVVRKLGLPYNEEVAFGAIASGGIKTLNEDMMERAGLDENTVEQVVEKEKKELKRRQKEYGSGLLEGNFDGKTIILVDDGIATGATMRAAIKGLRQINAKRIILAVPTAPPDVLREMKSMVDETFSLMTPSPFGGVGAWYQDFAQTTDDAVRNLLEKTERLS